MSKRTLFVGLLALIAGTAAAVAANQMLRSWPTVPTPGPATAEIVTAKTELHRGRTIRADDLLTRDWPKELVPPGAIREVGQAEGRVALTTHYENQPLLESQLAPRDVHTGLAAIVPPGMRAFTIHIPTVTTGVAGFVLPGNYVDVLCTLGSSGRGTDSVTVTLLQHVEILAVDQELDVPNDNKVDAQRIHSVTLLDTPEQAAKLSLAEVRGTLQLTLRNPDDDSPAEVASVSLADLQFLTEGPQPEVEPAPEVVMVGEPVSVAEVKKPRPRVVQIRTLRGTQSGVVMVRVPEPAEESGGIGEVE